MSHKPSEGKQKQFIEAYDAYSDEIFRYCYSRTSDREKSLDLVQDVFQKCWLKLAKNEVIEDFRPFLYQVAKRKIIDEYRRKTPQNWDTLEHPDLAVDQRVGVETQQDRKITAELILQHIETLDDKYREAVYFRYIEEYKPREIAKITGESENTISIRINRGIKKLRNVIGTREDWL